MDLVTIFRIARTRWRVVVPVLLITAFAAVRIYTDGTTTSYSVSGSQLLVAGRGNLSAEDEAQVAGVGAGILADLLRRPSILRQLTADGLSEKFTFSLGEIDTTLRLEVVGTSPEQAVDTAARLVDLAPGLLEASLGVQAAQAVTVEQATVGTPEDATPSGDGEYVYSTVLLIGSSSRSTLNPFPATLATVRSLVAVAESVPFFIEVARTGAGATFEVTGNVREAPLLEITVSAPSRDAAIVAHQFILAALRTELDALQVSAVPAPEARTQMLTLVDATVPLYTSASKVRPVAAVVIVGSGLAIALATVVEAIAADRRRRREERGDPLTDAGDDAGEDAADDAREGFDAEPNVGIVARSIGVDDQESAGADPVVTGGRDSRGRYTRLRS